MIKEKTVLVWEMSDLISTDKVEWWLGVYMRETENKDDDPGLSNLCLGDWYKGWATRGDGEKKDWPKLCLFFYVRVGFTLAFCVTGALLLFHY